VQRYNAFEHLYRSLFAKPTDLFVMLTAYFDEAGTSPNQPAPVVAGYIASTFQWKRFGEQWDKLLGQWKVPINPKYGIRIAHRKDLEHCVGVFKGWTREDRERFLEKAYMIIKRHTRAPIGNTVVREEFEEFALKPMQRIVSGAYGFCAYTCLQGIKEYCDHHNHQEPVRVVFEAGATGWGQLSRLFSYLQKHQQLREFYRLDSISFETKKIKQLQAADFLAYDLGRFFLDQRLKQVRPAVNAKLRALIGPKKPEPEDDHIRFWHEASLKGHAKMLSDAGLFKD
jgi:uncharacterized protein (DUF2164 family)